MASSTESPLVLVDGFNLLHAVILQGRGRSNWWSTDNQAQVVALTAKYSGPERCIVVFDAARADSLRLATADGGGIFYAPSADDWIVEQAAKNQQRVVTVVSADRSLVDRAKCFGAVGMSPWLFAQNCNS